MFGTSEQEGVSVDVTGEGFSTTTVDNGMHWFELRILPLPLRRGYIKRQRGNSSVDLNPIVYGSFLHCFVSFSGTDNRQSGAVRRPFGQVTVIPCLRLKNAAPGPVVEQRNCRPDVRSKWSGPAVAGPAGLMFSDGV